MERKTLFLMSSLLGSLALLLEFYVNLYSYVASIIFVALSIYFRSLGAKLSERSTHIESKGSDSIISMSAAVWFVLFEALKYAVLSITNSTVYTFVESMGKTIDILIITLVAGLISNSYFYRYNKTYRDYRKILRKKSVESKSDLLQKYRRFANATLGIPLVLAVLPSFIMFPLNLILSFPRLLEAFERTERTRSTRHLFAFLKAIDVEGRLWGLADRVAKIGKGQSNIWLPLNFLLPSFMYGFFDPFLSTSVALKISYSLMLLPGMILLFLVNTKFLSSGIQSVRLVIFILLPFYVLLALSLIFPSMFLLQFPVVLSIVSHSTVSASVARLISLKLSFLLLFFCVSYFSVFGVMQSLTLFAEESHSHWRRQLVVTYQYFFIPYFAMIGLVLIVYLDLIETIGVLASVLVFVSILSVGIFGSILFVRLKAGWR